MARMQRDLIEVFMLLACVSVPGCRKDDPPAATSGPASSTSDPKATPSTPTPPGFDRIAPRDMAAIGVHNGFVSGGMMHAAIRLPTVLPWLRSIPLPGELARDLAEFSEDTGVDWRAENLERRFSLTSDAVISMTLLRPLETGAAELRGELSRGGAVLDALAAAMTADAPPVPSVDPTIARTLDESAVVTTPVEKPTAPTRAKPPTEAPPATPTPVVEPLPPAPPSLTVAELEWGKKLLESASALGLHSRFSVTVTDPKPLLAHVRARAPREAELRWASVCAGIPGAVCLGDAEVVAIVRSTEHTVVLDLLMFATRSPDVNESQRKAVADALAMPAMTTDLGLRGDAAASIDATTVLKFAELDTLRRGLSAVRYSSDDRDQSARTSLEEATALVGLAAAPQLFTGARLGATIHGEDLHAELRWLLVPGQASTSTAVFATAASTAPVPTIATLCDGALFCWRTAGLLRPSVLAERLGVGAWSQGPDAADRSVGRLDEMMFLHAFAASWPNLLGSAARLPAIELGGGPEGAIASNLLDMLGRVEGTGGSLRSATVSRSRVAADYAVYVRTTVADTGVPRGMLSLAGQTMLDVTLPGAGGPAAAYTLPEDEIPATLITRVDPAVGGTPSTSGWIGLVDALDRMSWLLALPMEPHAGPAVYAEIPDLARLVAIEPQVARDLEPMRGFFERRSLRASLELVAGEPVVRAVLARTP